MHCSPSKARHVFSSRSTANEATTSTRSTPLKNKAQFIKVPTKKDFWNQLGRLLLCFEYTCATADPQTAFLTLHFSHFRFLVKYFEVRYSQ